jgi:hypothetical protein
VRNFRQALASPHPVQQASRFGAASPVIVRIETTMFRSSRIVLLAALLAVTSACAMSLRNPSIADLRRNPGHYQNRTVSVSGVVTTSWGLPVVPFRFYKVDDGTGEVTILSEKSRTPAQGERVRVKGRVDDIAVLGGRPVGLHLREESLFVKR